MDKKEKLLLVTIFLLTCFCIALGWATSGLRTIYTRRTKSLTSSYDIISLGLGRKWLQIDNDMADGYKVVVTSNTPGALEYVLTSTEAFSTSGTEDWYIKHSSDNSRIIAYVEGR